MRFARTHVSVLAVGALIAALYSAHVSAQTAPNRTEIRAYKGLLAAAIKGEANEVERLLAAGANPNEADAAGRTALHLAAHREDSAVARALVKGGADPNVQDTMKFDILTIAAARNNVDFLKTALEFGASPGAVTSPYGGTALTAAASLGHHAAVRELLKAGAPVDYVNRFGWTPLLEAVKIGNGGPNHVSTVEALLAFKANPNFADRTGATALQIARGRGYSELARLIEEAGGR